MNRRSFGTDGRPTASPPKRPTDRPARHRVIEPLENRLYFSPVVFSQPALFPTGTNPDAVVTADLTGNGKLDVITADFSSASVAVLRGNGDGTLQAPVFYSVGNSPQAIATGDFNGDGIPDIVTANEGSDTISVLLGNGDGTFQPQVTYATGVRPEAIALGDLTGDGHLDIVTANQGSNSVSVLMNNGDGTFAPAVSYFAGYEPDGLAVGDVNGDERPDIVTVNPIYSNLHVLLNNGDGTFKLAGTYTTGSTARSVAIANVNSDGRPDLITSNLHGTSISLLLNNGDGTFQTNTDFGTGAFPYSIVAADVTGDGRPDIITANNFDNTVGVLARNAAGGFFPELAFHAGTGPVAVTVGDLNGDGKPDLIAVDFNTNEVAVDLNRTVFVPLIPTTITLTPQLNPVQTGNVISLTAQLTPASPGKAPPVGIVQFFSGDYVVGIGHVNAAGVASVLVRLPLGTSNLSAHYAGDSFYSESLSPTVVEQAIPAAEATPFIVPAIASTTLPSVIVPGQTGTARLTLTNTGAGIARGSVNVQLYASQDGALDASAMPISTASNVSLNLIGGQVRPLNIPVTFSSTGFEPGTYTILAVLTPVQGLTAAQVSSTAAAAASTVLGSLGFGTIGKQVHRTLTRMENGSLVTFKLTGNGVGFVTENADGSVTLAMSATNQVSNLTITTAPGVGSGAVTLEGLSSTTDLGIISAPTTTLVGSFSVVNAAGAILGAKQLTLAGVTDGTMSFGGSSKPRLSLGTVDGLTILSYQPFLSLTVSSWSNTSADQITVPWIATLSSTGDFGASLIVSGAKAPGRKAIRSAVIGGTLGDAVWSIGSNLPSLQVGGVAAGWSGSVKGTVGTFIDTGDFAGQFAAHDFDSIQIDGSVNTGDILAGADFGADARLGNNDDFFGSGSIASLRIDGSVTGSVIAAGLAPLGDILIGPGTTLQHGAIHSVAITGNVDDASRIVAQSLPATVSIDGTPVNTDADPRFKLD